MMLEHVGILNCQLLSTSIPPPPKKKHGKPSPLLPPWFCNDRFSHLASWISPWALHQVRVTAAQITAIDIGCKSSAVLIWIRAWEKNIAPAGRKQTRDHQPKTYSLNKWIYVAEGVSLNTAYNNKWCFRGFEKGPRFIYSMLLPISERRGHDTELFDEHVI